MKQRRDAISCKLLVKALGYLVSLSMLFIWEVYRYDITNIRMYYLNVLSNFIDVIEQHSSMNFSMKDVLELVLSSTDIVVCSHLLNFERQVWKYLQIVIVLDLVLERPVNVLIGWHLDFKVCMDIRVTENSLLNTNFIAVNHYRQFSRKHPTREVFSIP